MTPVEKTAASFSPFECDCATTVALKISDDSCKMDDEQRAIFMALYDALPPYQSDIFTSDIHDVITAIRSAPDAMLFARVKKERENAMAIITQERMKAFKASSRGKILIHTASKE